MIKLAEVFKGSDDNHAEASEIHLFKVEILDHETAEVVSRYVKKQFIGGYRIGGEYHHQYLRVGLVERKVDGGFFADGSIIGQADVPQHSAHIGAAAGMQFTPGSHTFEPCRGDGRHIRIRIALKHRSQGGIELVGVVFRNVSQGIQEHKLGHKFAHRKFVGHTLIAAMHSLVIIGHISFVGIFVYFFLNGIHLPQVVDIVGVTQSLAIFAIFEFMHYHLTIPLGHIVVAGAYKHQIDIVVRIQTIYIIGIVHKQTVKFLHGRIKVIEFVLEYDTHIEQAFLYDIVRHSLVGITEGYLLEIVLAIMRVFGFFLLLLLLGRNGVYRIFSRILGIFIGGTTAVKVAHGKGGLIATAPVVFELTCAPSALKFGLAGVASGRIIEVPTIIGVQRIRLRGRGLSHIRVVA